ncbi:MAG: hypothetical protein N2515_06710, partial [Deltaproteobacteria bacterium]|nr:hypothetical protein [Deltaproteobacteria bacterium]
AIARLPIKAMNPSVPLVSVRRYTPLPRPSGWNVRNRFVGDWLLYGSANSSHPVRDQLYVLPVRGHALEARQGKRRWIELDLGHSVERIEALGNDALAIGRDANSLVFSPIRFDGGEAKLLKPWRRPQSAQSESRTHAFFFRQDGPHEGIVGLPMRSSLGSAQAFRHGFRGGRSAGVLFLRFREDAFSELGVLWANPHASLNDNCLASCVDWYGNARPIFWRGRVFALLGYELIEGKIEGERMVEVERTNFLQGTISREGEGVKEKPRFAPIDGVDPTIGE